jgi:hypothetical protein
VDVDSSYGLGVIVMVLLGAHEILVRCL